MLYVCLWKDLTIKVKNRYLGIHQFYEWTTGITLDDLDVNYDYSGVRIGDIIQVNDQRVNETYTFQFTESWKDYVGAHVRASSFAEQYRQRKTLEASIAEDKKADSSYARPFMLSNRGASVSSAKAIVCVAAAATAAIGYIATSKGYFNK